MATRRPLTPDARHSTVQRRSTRKLARTLSALALCLIPAALAAAVSAAPASAATYYAEACDGTDSASGWTGNSYSPDGAVGVGINCGNGSNSMVANAPGQTTNTDYGLLTFNAPSGVSITGFLPVNGVFYSSWPWANGSDCGQGCAYVSGYEAGIFTGSLDAADDAASNMLLDAEAPTTTSNAWIGTGSVSSVSFGVWCATNLGNDLTEDQGGAYWGGCVTDENGNYDGAYLQGADLQLDDSFAQPSATGASWSIGNPGAGSWYDTDGSADPTLTLDAADPAGVCVLGARLTNGANTAYSPNLVAAPTVVGSTGSATTFTSATPCATSAGGSYALPAGLASGSYSLSMTAANPSNYAGGGTSVSSAPTVASGFSTIEVDDTTPALSWPNQTSGYVAGPDATLQIVAGPSGLDSVSCSDAGHAVTATQLTGAASGSGTTTWAVPIAQAGAVQCTAANGDVNAQISGASPSVLGATAPTVTLTGTGSSWDTTSPQTVTVAVDTDGSGLASLACSLDGGASVPVSTTASGETYTGSLTVSGNGSHELSCAAVSGARVTGSTSGTVNIDTTQPTLSFSDPGYTQDTWVSAPQAVTVDSNEPYSGTTGISCSTDDTTTAHVSSAALSITAVDAANVAGQITVGSQGRDTLTCQSTAGNGLASQPATYEVNVDDQAPTVSFSGAAADGSWLSGTPSVVVTGNEAAPLSGTREIDCTVNGGSTIALPVNASDGYTSSFALTQNGTDQVACQATSGAGVSGPVATETINLDNPSGAAGGSDLTQYGSSPDIDNGADPFTGGSSQTTWYHDQQSVTVTAVNTAGGAAISQITCSGASQAVAGGTYPANSQNAYGSGGEQITVTVQPPGGDLSCSAEDSAGNTYPLGSYEFEIDNQAPTGYFEPQDSWPQPDELQVYVTDGAQGSGTATVEVTAQDGNGPIYKVMATRDPPDQDVWEADFDDSTIPPGTYTFVAYPTDVAGNSDSLTTNQAGGTENLGLPLRDMTALSDTLTAGTAKAAGSQQPTVTATVLAEPNGNPRERAALAIAKLASCRKPKAAAKGKGKAKPCSATNKKATPPKTGFVTVPFGKTAKLTGTLTDDKSHKPIAGASVVIEQQVLGRSTVTTLGTVKTGKHGAYSFRVRAGASRTLLAVYDGTPQLRGAQANVGERVRGKASLKVTGTLRPGHELLVAGKLRGGFVPAGGALVTVQYAVAGFRGWTNWGDTRTTAKGAFAVHMPVLAADAGHTFKWRAIVKAQSGWAFLAGQSNTVTRAIA